MKKTFFDETPIMYLPAHRDHWTGRASNPDLENQYWHQEITLCDIDQINSNQAIDIGLLGYACDEGVRRNLGRVGAAEGPKLLRDRLAKLPIHFEEKTVADFGDLCCVKNDMESCQLALKNSVRHLISKNVFPIIIGGGHDMAFGHFMGLREAVKNTDKSNIGILNFDAHFDLRNVDEKPNSGTPFNQLINELAKTNEQLDYFAVGIQRQSNTKELFDIAKNAEVGYAINYECESSSEELKSLQQKLKPFIDRNDHIYITIDMDGFSSAYAPGVSAPSPLGFTPYFVFKMLHFLFETEKVISCDIAELNPKLDRDNLTANLAAKLVDFIVMKLNKKDTF